ncbi:MAG TPA: PIN domain nuclease [Terriglobales bacterium]|nr:PIN domain nuclease [Terriglobales bacterium]
MVLVDTTVWIDYLGGIANPHTVWLDRELGRQPIGLTDLIYCELLQGIRNDVLFPQIRRDLERLTIFDSGGKDLALTAAQNYRLLRKRGITVRKTIDCLIATFCIEAGHELLHRDRDFDAFEEHRALRVIHP